LRSAQIQEDASGGAETGLGQDRRLYEIHVPPASRRTAIGGGSYSEGGTGSRDGVMLRICVLFGRSYELDMVTQSGRLCEFSVFAVLVYRGRAMSVLAPRAVNIERVVKVLATFFGYSVGYGSGNEPIFGSSLLS